MKYENDHIRELLIERIAGTISEEDAAKLERALAEDRSAYLLGETLSDQFESLHGRRYLNNLNPQEGWLRLLQTLESEEPVNALANVEPKITQLFSTRKLAMVAAVLLLACAWGGVWLHQRQRLSLQTATVQPEPTSVASEGKQVVLTLANGKSIVLDNAENGVLAKTGDIEIHKTADGQLVYQVTQTGEDGGQPGLNTISTPSGGQYQIILPDNSKVWLNTASSLKFPSAFRGNTREVELVGEAYFEVTKNSSMPFIVKSKLGEIEVLGTGFNVMAYADESLMKTTLVEGSVKITGKGTKVLRPGEQAILDQETMRVERVDVDGALAWKNNLFQFNDTPIEVIMREVSRWYNVEVVYREKIPDRSFTGKISRDVSISEFLEMLSYTGLRFDIDGKRVIVL